MKKYLVQMWTTLGILKLATFINAWVNICHPTSFIVGYWLEIYYLDPGVFNHWLAAINVTPVISCDLSQASRHWREVSGMPSLLKCITVFFSSSFFFWETRPLSACSLAGPEQLGENSDKKIQKRDDIGSVVLFCTSETYGACSAGIKFTEAFERFHKADC